MKKLIFLTAALVFSVEAFPLEPKKPSDFVFLKAIIQSGSVPDVGCVYGYKFKDGLTGNAFQIPKNRVFVITSVSWQRWDPGAVGEATACAGVYAGGEPAMRFCGVGAGSGYGGSQTISPGVVTRSPTLCIHPYSYVSPSSPEMGEAYLYGFFAKDK